MDAAAAVGRTSGVRGALPPPRLGELPAFADRAVKAVLAILSASAPQAFQV